MDFSFPLTTDDTRTSHNVAHNYLDADEVPDRLSEVRAAFSHDGPLAVLRHYDELLSVVKHFSQLERKVKNEAWEILLEGTGSLYYVLNTILDTELSQSDKQQHCNAVKMLCYLVTQFMVCTQREESRTDHITTPKPNGRRRKPQQTTTEDGVSSLSSTCVRGLYAILHLLELEIHRLWDPPIPEENFVTCVTSCCYKLMENSSLVKDKESRQLMFQVLVIAIQRYNHSIGAVVKMIQLVQNFEHLVIPLAEGIQFFAVTRGVKNIVPEMIREIGSMNPSDLSRDTSGTRSLSQFLCELGERVPSFILPTISSLVPHLDGENYSFRNSILVVIGEMVSQVLSCESTNEGGKVTRQQFLDRLLQHIHDINAFVRSKVLQIWLKLFKEQVVPLSHQHQLIPLVVGRLHDKSSIVRRHAIQFLSTALCGNPYAAKLSLNDLQRDLEQAEKKLNELQGLSSQSSPEQHQSQSTDMSHHSETEDDAIADSQELVRPEVQQGKETAANEKEIQQHQVLVTYLKDSVKFVQQLEAATPVVCQLLGSKTVSDVLEAINFFVTCHEFGISAAHEGVKKMLVLIWSRETSVRDAVTVAYKRLYLTQSVEGQRARAATVADSLISLTYNMTLGERASLEELVCHFMRNKDIPHAVIQCLWQQFSTSCADDVSTTKSNAAILLLGMLSGEDHEVVKCNLDVLVTYGLRQEQQAKVDLKKAQLTCIALQKIVKAEKVKPGALPPVPFRVPQDHSIVESLKHLVLSTMCDFECSEWMSFAEQAITTIYKLSEHPDVVCERLIISMTDMLSSQFKTDGEISSLIDELKEAEPLAQSSQDPSASGVHILPTPPEKTVATCSSVFLARLLTVVGQVAVCQLVHLDVAVYKELKRRQGVEEREKDIAKEKEKEEVEKKRKGRRSKHRNSASGKEMDDGTSLAEEIGLEGAAAEDTEAETIRCICETEVVTGRNLLSSFRSFIVMICAQPSKYPDRQLRVAATLALSRFMAVSSEFCDAHLQLLFTILEKPSEAVIRSNTIIAIGDLTTRFPNLVEPWTPHLYARLSDKSAVVRKNTLIVLTRLILNDMLKVKGHISEIAVCLEDENEHIKKLAWLFFHELSHKGNAIYNILPDIISQLSDPDRALPQQQFTTIMKYLISFIQKDKQSESLIEKLCQRIRAARTDHQSTELAFCLAQLPFTEKGMRKLQDNFACYSDRLASDEMYSHFMTIIGKAKKFAKPEMKALVDELEKSINECHFKGMEEDNTAHRAAQASKKVRVKRRQRDTKHAQQSETPHHQVDIQQGESADEFDVPRRRELRPCNERQKPQLRTRKATMYDNSESDALDSDSNDASPTSENSRENVNPYRSAKSQCKTRSGRKSRRMGLT